MKAVRHTNYKIQPLLKHVTKIKRRTKDLFSFVVTCYEESYDQINDCIKSILLTECCSVELIVCFDRIGTEEFKKISEEYKDMSNIKVLEHENLGSSGNKNFGMLLTHGEYIACVGGDMIVNTGAVSNFLIAFNENPKAAIVYTGYSFISEKDRTFPAFSSYETDEKDILARNAIDATMPQRFKYAVMFDTAFKSLGDWDWAITHIYHYKHKVYWDKNFLAYKHTIPPATGLSSHSHKNWNAIINCLCDKYNLTKFNERTCILGFGIDHHTKRLADLTGWDVNDNIVNKAYNYKRCLILGFYRNQWEKYFRAIKNNPETKFSVLFIGSDIAGLNYRSMNEALYLKNYLKDHNITVYTEDKRCQKNLAVFQIDSEIMPLPVVKPKEFKNRVKANNRFKVGIYTPLCPLKEHGKYSIPFYIDLMMATPQIDYIVFGGQEDQSSKLPNVEFRGWTPIERIIRDTDVLLRILPFDGLSITAVQYMMCGKPVVVNHKLAGAYPLDIDENYMHEAKSAKNAMDLCINRLMSMKNSDKTFAINQVSNSFDASVYTIDKFLETFNRTQGE